MTTRQKARRTDGSVPCRAGKLQGKRKRAYRVGYGRPPKEYQFKPGQSGNPKGRPKNSFKSPLKRMLLELLDNADDAREH